MRLMLANIRFVFIVMLSLNFCKAAGPKFGGDALGSAPSSFSFTSLCPLRISSHLSLYAARSLRYLVADCSKADFACLRSRSICFNRSEGFQLRVEWFSIATSWDLGV